ncbi:hypothetical protein [Anaeromyxobacter sp. PSR-1]|uniref:hypothetical protein n=1 Tax=Anaeromyxobacter sp. PSR-1 TaxID=1300915 RepID=UPI0005E98E2C|nr:hypothetical protein [Anaeromyxobacter sp. PSR-1]GAO02689.1 hypothetical protein PSR1_01562 [Anaeromyxobacter sp. PSR-1]
MATCGWKGKIDPAMLGRYDGYLAFECPHCDKCLAIIPFPTVDDIKANWDGFTELQKSYYGTRFSLDGEFEAHHLERPDQLPDLPDDPLVLVWDYEETPDPELERRTETPSDETRQLVTGLKATKSHTAIKHDGRAIWRERAYYQCLGRYAQVIDILKQKYGERLKDLVPSTGSTTYLLGDDLSGWEKLEGLRQRMSPRAVSPELRLRALAKAGDQQAASELRRIHVDTHESN